MQSAKATVLLDRMPMEEDFSVIEFRNTSIGRQPFIKGTGIAVWEFIMAARGFDLTPSARTNTYNSQSNL